MSTLAIKFQVFSVSKVSKKKKKREIKRDVENEGVGTCFILVTSM